MLPNEVVSWFCRLQIVSGVVRSICAPGLCLLRGVVGILYMFDIFCTLSTSLSSGSISMKFPYDRPLGSAVKTPGDWYDA